MKKLFWRHSATTKAMEVSGLQNPILKAYIIVREEGEYSDREWAILGVFSNLDHAYFAANTLMSREWLENMWHQEGQHSSFHIEVWDLNGKKESDETLPIVFQSGKTTDEWKKAKIQFDIDVERQKKASRRVGFQSFTLRNCDDLETPS